MKKILNYILIVVGFCCFLLCFNESDQFAINIVGITGLIICIIIDKKINKHRR